MHLDEINLQIERLVQSDNLTYIEAAVHFAETRKLDVEDVVEMLHPNIIEKIKTEFIKRNHFPDNKIDNSLDDFIESE